MSIIVVIVIDDVDHAIIVTVHGHAAWHEATWEMETSGHWATALSRYYYIS